MSQEQLLRDLLDVYRPEEFPALDLQIRLWRQIRPFAGKRLLDATPVFRNTMVKYLALLAGGAELTVAPGRGVPYDPQVVDSLAGYGISTSREVPIGAFDVVLDCAGVNSNVESRCGFVELTRSGLYRYEQCNQPVYLADEGKIKVIETALGTGDGFRRGMERLGYGDFSGRSLLLFGCGKVGRGIALYAKLKGAKVTIVDDPRRVKTPAGCALIDRFDRAAIETAVDRAWCVVTATGIRHSLAGSFDLRRLAESDALIANMGVEDEFGPELPPERVLNRKEPLNFLLEEPTQLRYIDPTMALHNYGAFRLLNEPGLAGLIRPDSTDEAPWLAAVREAGLISEELAQLEAMA